MSSITFLGNANWIELKAESVGKIVASNGAKIGKGGLVTLLGGPMRGTFTARSSGLILLFK